MSRVIIPGVTHMAIINLGDGSATAKFFSSQEAAEAYLEEDEERLCDDIRDITCGVEVDSKRWEWEYFTKWIATYTIDGTDTIAIDTLAKRLEVSRPTIKLWSEGRNLPHPALRETVLRFVREGK